MRADPLLSLRAAALSPALAVFAIALGMLAAGPAQAQRVSKVDGVTLMKACTGPRVTDCDAYVDGFGDAISAEGKAAAIACLPLRSTGTELRDVLIAYLKAHPEDQHARAADIAKSAFAKAYPCNK